MIKKQGPTRTNFCYLLYVGRNTNGGLSRRLYIVGSRGRKYIMAHGATDIVSATVRPQYLVHHHKHYASPIAARQAAQKMVKLHEERGYDRLKARQRGGVVPRANGSFWYKTRDDEWYVSTPKNVKKPDRRN